MNYLTYQICPKNHKSILLISLDMKSSEKIAATKYSSKAKRIPSKLQNNIIFYINST